MGRRQPILKGSPKPTANWVPTSTAALMIGCTTLTAWRYAATGRLRAERRRGGAQVRWFIDPASITTFLKERRTMRKPMDITDIMGCGIRSNDRARAIDSIGARRNKKVRLSPTNIDWSLLDAAIARRERDARAHLDRQSPLVRNALLIACHEMDVRPFHLLLPQRGNAAVAAARSVAANLLVVDLGVGISATGRILRRDHSTIYHHIYHRDNWTDEEREVLARCRAILRTHIANGTSPLPFD